MSGLLDDLNAFLQEHRRCGELPLLVLGLLLSGCGPETTTVGHQTYIYKTTAGQEILTTLPCGNVADPCNERYRSATITDNPTDEEFWQFERRIQVRAAIGIPYGRMPQDVNVIGTREQCEAVRSKVKDDPTEPCKGPFYFHRDENK